jgi:hypothetical protein
MTEIKSLPITDISEQHLVVTAQATEGQAIGEGS